MAKLNVTIKTTPPLTALAADVKTVVLKINTAPVRVTAITADVSAAPDNIISQNPDGLYASIEKPNDILNFITAFDNALTQG